MRYAKPLAIFGALSALCFTLAALSAPVPWGVPSDAGITALLDSGVQTSMCFKNSANVGALYCTVYDAGASNVASVGVAILGSNDCVHFAQINSGFVFVGGPSTLAVDPITSAASYWAVQIDAGASAPQAGYISCTDVHRSSIP